MRYEYANHMLQRICEKLQLQSYLYKQADERYHIITNLLKEDEAFLNVNLDFYPQGSFRLKTTVKPLKQNEYDLDFVAEVSAHSNMSPEELYNHIYRILANDKNHKGMIEKKSRCVRINYANLFHIDIMPGKACIGGDKFEIIVPDKKLSRWYHHSNPRGYSNWFEQQTRTRILNEMACFKKSIVEQTEPLSNQADVVDLEPLRKAVQLIKRYRDIFCNNNNKEPVRSIVICTLMGYVSNLYTDTITIIHNFIEYVKLLIRQSNNEPFVLNNPVVNENLTDKWMEDRRCYDDFVSMMESMSADVNELMRLDNSIELNKKIKEMFGEYITNEIIKEDAERLYNLKEKGALTLASDGSINEAVVNNYKCDNVINVKRNTFYD